MVGHDGMHTEDAKIELVMVGLIHTFMGESFVAPNPQMFPFHAMP